MIPFGVLDIADPGENIPNHQPIIVQGNDEQPAAVQPNAQQLIVIQPNVEEPIAVKPNYADAQFQNQLLPQPAEVDIGPQNVLGCTNPVDADPVVRQGRGRPRGPGRVRGCWFKWPSS